MRVTLKVGGVVVFIVSLVFLMSGQTGLEPTYRAEPPPTGSTQVAPILVRPEQVVTFTASNVVDKDTKTSYSISGSNCSSSESLVSDGTSGSKWTIIDPGTDGIIEKSGLVATHQVASWKWEDGDGDYGSSATTSGAFLFDDGRQDSDPRHDSQGLGGGSAKKIVPDEITTALGSGPRCIGRVHLGHCFKHTLLNQDEPAFNFAGMGLREEILLITCDNPDPALIAAIIAAANGTWTIVGQNAFNNDDCHGAGSDMSQLLMNNSSVSLFQVYRITSWGWPGKNPTHAIGMQRGISFSHLQLITFVEENPNMIRVTKNGISCGCTASTCGS